jgi:glutathione-regulated potassium-efflux system ancillary protein KefG
MKQLLIQFVHPYPRRSRLNRRMAEAVRGLEGVEVNDLYERYPEFHIDVEREQALLRRADILVFQHPFYWYSAPALLKQWLDLVLERGFAHGREGNALRGKALLSAVTTGLAEAHYLGEARPAMAELLLPFAQIAGHCGMTYLEPFVVHGAGQMEEEDPALDAAAERYRARLLALRGGERG